MIQITGLSVPLSYKNDLLKTLSAKTLGIEPDLIRTVTVLRRSVDISDKNDVRFRITIRVDVEGEARPIVWQCRNKSVSWEEDVPYTFLSEYAPGPLKGRPVVIGFGPAGLFAALILAQAGVRPIVLERGPDVDSRTQSIGKFWETGVLDPEANVQYGEGGAGAFSDGKLKIGAMDPRKRKVIQELIKAGAPEEIAWLEKPHIGTDRLPGVVKAIRSEILALGGEVHFHTVAEHLVFIKDKVAGVRYVDCGKSGRSAGEIETEHVVLAIGHSAEDTFRALCECGILLQARPIAVGVRIEHPQRHVDTLRYGAFAGHPLLGAADYRMVVHLPNGRGVYTFCMCPGGSVIAAASDPGRLVTNGMSPYRRDGKNANTALLVTVDRTEYESDHPFAAIDYRRRIEEKAFLSAGGEFHAPVQRLEDFLEKRDSAAFGEVLPTYRPGTAFRAVESYLPAEIAASLREAIREMNDWMPGFAFPDAVLTGAETRSSSPVCIPRSDDLQAFGKKGVYPCGEGAGYAGGILSAAVDGIRCAEQILSGPERFKIKKYK